METIAVVIIISLLSPLLAVTAYFLFLKGRVVVSKIKVYYHFIVYIKPMMRRIKKEREKEGNTEGVEEIDKILESKIQ